MKKVFSILLVGLFVVVGFISGCISKPKDPSKDLNTYSIQATFDDQTKTLVATQTVEYTNQTDVVLDNLQFHLYPNAFRQGAVNKPVSLANTPKAYPNGLSYGGIDIQDVKVDNKQTQHTITGTDQNILKVDLQQELYPDDSVNVYLAYEVTLPNIHHRFGYGDNTYNFGNFYPVVCVYEEGFVTKPYNSNGDPFYSDMANYNVKLSFDKEFALASTGEVVSNTSNEQTQISLQARAVRDFAFVLSKKFKIISSKCGDTVVSYHYYDDDNAQANLQVAVDSLNTFNQLFGEYPYSTLNVAKTNFVHGGMEYPNLVYISDAVTDLEEYQNTIVHEIAHQWWYNLVGSNAYDNPWQDEGLTEFSTILFFENNPHYQVDTTQRLNNTLASYMLFIDVYKSVGQEVDTSMNRALDEYNSEIEYVYMTYVKGMLMFEQIRDCMGNKKFIKALQYYFEQNCYTNAMPDDLIYALNKKGGSDIQGVLEAYLTGSVVLQRAD